MDLLAAEGLVCLAGLGLLTLGAIYYPLEPVAGAAAAGHARAPWLFVGVQELLKHLPAWLAGLVLPVLAACYLGALPWLARRVAPVLPTFHRRPSWHEPLALLLVLAWLALTIIGFK